MKHYAAAEQCFCAARDAVHAAQDARDRALLAVYVAEDAAALAAE